MKPDRPIPPPLAQRFLRWFIKDELAEEVLGDLEEQYEAALENNSPFQAKLNYWYQVFHYLRPFAIRNFKSTYSNPTLMFRHNFIISFRHFKRYKSTFLINLMGLSSGLACALLIYLWVSDELSIDKFHENDSQLFQVMGHQHFSDGIVTSVNTPGLLAETLSEQIPEVQYATVVSPRETYYLSLKETYIKAVGIHASQDYFHTFSFPLVQGDKNQVLTDKNSIVLSEKLAMTLFQTTENIMGETVVFQDQKQYQVSGVFEDIPANSSEQFDFILSFEVYKTENPWVLEWGNNVTRTYLVLYQDSQRNEFNNKIADLVKKREAGLNITLFLKPFSENYLYGQYENGELSGGRITYVRLFAALAVFILLIACINFVNLSTARASRRLKEVGVKKSIGVGRQTLIFQYLGESMLIAFSSMALAVLLVLLFLPRFNEVTGKQLLLGLDPNLFLSVLCITLLTGLIAGSYPAFYLSAFGPISILKGRFSTSTREVWTRKGLVVFQFMISVILMVSVLVVYQQIEYVQTKNLGYHKDNILNFTMEGRVKENSETFLSELKKMPGIINASSIAHSMVEGGNTTGGVRWEGKSQDHNIPIEFINVNYDMIETLGIEMVEGRTFSRDYGSDTTKIIFNQAAIDVMGLSEPIGKVVHLWGKDMQIIGVTKNFHFESLHENVKPLLFHLAPEKTDKIMAKVEAGREKETLDRLQAFYSVYNPEYPLDYHFLDEDYQALYAAEQRVATLSQYFAALAILISCLGLFGLAAFTAERRLKEIGIRKILGSSNLRIVYLLSSDFTKMVFIAILIALPVSYFIAQRWLESFAFRIDLEWWYFIGAGLVALLIAWFTVGMQTVKAARVNPLDCLRDE